MVHVKNLYNTCVKCKRKVEMPKPKDWRIAKIASETKEAYCNKCLPLSNWRRRGGTDGG